VVDIRELAVRLLTLLFVVIIVLLAATYLAHTNVKVDEGAANNITDIALKTALKDSYVAGIISQSDVQYTAFIKPVKAGFFKGYLNYPGNLTDVLINAKQGYIPAFYRFDVIVDTGRKRIMDRATMLDLVLGPETIIIPPGSAWYYRIMDGDTIVGGSMPPPPLVISSSYIPPDASALLAVVDSEGFEKLINASEIGDLRKVNLSGNSLWLNRSALAGTGGNASIDVPFVNEFGPVNTTGPRDAMAPGSLSRPADDYYLVIINEDDNREVTVTLSTTFGSFW